MMMNVEQLRELVYRQAGEIEFRLRHFVCLLKSDAAELGPAEPVPVAQYFATASSILDSARKLVLTLDAIRGLEEQEEDRRREASRSSTADV